ncbi:MAG TPA: nucleotide exchange factor GrpE [Candidatus Limnocylindrales bacterium]|nr:nucleotide exchange factor GrpE [Candidatus Limnocylindrales bacterium]
MVLESSDRRPSSEGDQQLNPGNTLVQENSRESQIQEENHTLKEPPQPGEEAKGGAGEASPALESTTVETSEISSEGEKALERSELEQLKDQLLLKEKEVESYYDRLIRLQAEFENFRKRTIKEKAEFTKYANEELIKNLLPVLDNLERALTSAEQTKDFEGLSKGVEMIYKQFSEALKKAGLTEIEALNQRFDPVVHQAVARVESSDVENNTVVEVLQKGYYFHDRVLRPALVKVAVQSS